MLSTLRHIRKFFLSSLKRYSPGRLLQYLLALCRAVFSRCKSKCSGQDSSHESIPKTPTLAEGKESLSDEDIVTPVGHVISGSRTPAQERALLKLRKSPYRVCNQLLSIVYANHHHLVQGIAILSDGMYALQVILHSKKPSTGGPTVCVCLKLWPCLIVVHSAGVPLFILK